MSNQIIDTESLKLNFVQNIYVLSVVQIKVSIHDKTTFQENTSAKVDQYN